MGHIDWHSEGFQALRKDPALQDYLRRKGDVATEDLNAQLNLAQDRRGQREQDGYVGNVVVGRTRARLYITAATARAQAHEDAHDSLLSWAFRNGGQSPKKKG